MAIYELLASQHECRTASKELKKYVKGDTIETSKNLVVLFGADKFKLVSGVTTPPPSVPQDAKLVTKGKG